MADRNFSLLEELLLLRVEPKLGRFRQPYLRYALAGAALADLLLQKRLHLDADTIRVRQASPIGDEAIDFAFRRFPVTVRPRKATWWVRNFYSTARQPLDIAAGRLVEQGVLTCDRRSALWILHWTDYPVLEAAPIQRLHRRIREAILQAEPVEARLAVLISLLHHSGGLNGVLTPTERIEWEHRIVAICASQVMGYAVGRAIRDVIHEDEEARERAVRQVIVIEKPRKRPHPRRPSRPPWFPGRPPNDDEPWQVKGRD